MSETWGPWEQDPKYGQLRHRITISNSAMDSAPDSSVADADVSGAVTPDDPFGGNSAYVPNSQQPVVRESGPTIAEIKAAYDELRAHAAAVEHKYGKITPNTIFTGDEKGESILGALEGLVRSAMVIAASVSAGSKMGRSAADRALLDSWITASRVLSAARNSPQGAYTALASPKFPNAMDNVPVLNPTQFFNGVTHSVGKARYEEALAKSGNSITRRKSTVATSSAMDDSEPNFRLY